MSVCRLFLAAVGIAVANAVSAGPAIADARSATALHLSPRSVERIRAAGLDPSDPQLHTKLAQLARERLSAMMKAPPGLIRLTAIGGGTPPQNLQINRSLPPTAPLHGYYSQPAVPTIEGLTSPHWGSEWALDVGGVPQQLGSKSSASPWGIKGTGFTTQSSVALSAPLCGLNLTLAPSVESSTFLSVPWVRPLPLEPVNGTVTVTSNAKISASTPVFIWGGPGRNDFEVTVNAMSPHVSSGSGFSDNMGFRTTSANDRVSTNPFDSAVTGTDIIGYGIKLVNGYTKVTAKLVSVTSYMDGPADAPFNNSLRRASLSQPDPARLETTVNWEYAGGESITYTVRFIVEGGAFGMRALDSMPKQTTLTCEK